MNRRRAFTLIEVLVALVILVVLVSIIAVAGTSIMRSQRINLTDTMMNAVNNAVADYARFWPAGPHATKGWPEWDVHYLWSPADPLAYNVQQDPDRRGERDTNEPNECLTYALTAEVGTGPFLKKLPSKFLAIPQGGDDFNNRYSLPNHPVTGKPIGKGAPVMRLVDAWGTPLAYQWLNKDNLPIIETSTSMADHVRIFSAGPDRQFGSVGGDDSEQDNIYCYAKPAAGQSLWAGAP